MAYIQYRKIPIFILLIFIYTTSLGFAVDVTQDTTSQIMDTYSKNDLASKPPFRGGYINFGYWQDIISDDDKKPLTTQDRVNASFALYKLIIDKLEIKEGDRVLEAGCGLGYGCRYVASNYSLAELHCVDITPKQIERAKNIHSEILKQFATLKFEISSADSVKKASNSYDKIYSVEAAQYFPSMPKFASEAYRLLKPGGLLVVTAHFSTNQSGYEATKKLLPTVAQNIDRMIPIDEVRHAFTSAGFTEIKVETIGQYVFKGFDRWISQVGDAPWAYNIHRLYADGNIDYYVLVLKKL